MCARCICSRCQTNHELTYGASRQNIASTRFRGKARHVLEKRSSREQAGQLLQERARLRAELLHGVYGNQLQTLRRQLGYTTELQPN